LVFRDLHGVRPRDEILREELEELLQYGTLRSDLV
jgi:hypothetical protein